MPSLNDPSVIAELTALHDAYERALALNDVTALNAFFWDSPHVVRFGVHEHLYGAEAIAAYRQGTAPAFTERHLTRRTIVTFGPDTASIMCELHQTIGGQPRPSRQSQMWLRFPDLGWKIVSAHVSHLGSPAGDWGAYVDRTAAAVGLPIAAAHRTGVIQQLSRAAALATPLLAFPLPDTAEFAPVFIP